MTAAEIELPWIEVAQQGVPYFVTDTGEPWTPVGQNDSIAWIEFAGLFGRRDVSAVREHLLHLRAHGVTCLRFMLECGQSRHRYLERPVGAFVPAMVRLWDDLFRECERVGMRILLTPFDTFWMWLRWKHHPYSKRNGGPLDAPGAMLLDPGMRAAIKARFSFAIERWSGSGALFAWDLWNEIHPAQAGDSADGFSDFIADLSDHVRTAEMRLYGRTHPQTVSLFGPELVWRPQMDLTTPIFRHPSLDFANIHIYEQGTIDDPRNTVDPAIGIGRIVRDALAQIRDGRPFFDSEHGPIHRFKDHKRTLPEPFDDEYFRHMQWAHLASGGVGGGMRWPNRHPHRLTPGMRRAQKSLDAFLPLIDWTRFRRANLNNALRRDGEPVACFGCGDAHQAVIWCLRTDTVGQDGTLRTDAAPIRVSLTVPGLEAGSYRVVPWDTHVGQRAGEDFLATAGNGGLEIALPPFARDLALAVTRAV